MKVIIVGGVAGGASCAARLRRLDESAEILMVERGPYVSYANCGLPYYIGGVIEQQSNLLVATADTFRDMFAVDARTDCEVVGIAAGEKTVQLKDRVTGEVTTEHYDKLVLSPGAAPIRPPLPGIDLPGIFGVRTVPDAGQIRAWIDERRGRASGMDSYTGFQTRKRELRAVVVGGGFIGIETAENLVGLGFEVTLLQRGEQIMAPLDPEMARYVERHLDKHGVQVLLNARRPGSEQAADGSLEVLTASGEVYPADIVILGIGVRPETALAEMAGIEVGELGGIRVDDQMRTSDPDIFAVGDAVEKSDCMSGEWSSSRWRAGEPPGPHRRRRDRRPGLALPRHAGHGHPRRLRRRGRLDRRQREDPQRLGDDDFEKIYLYPNSHAGLLPRRHAARHEGHLPQVRRAPPRGAGRGQGGRRQAHRRARHGHPAGRHRLRPRGVRALLRAPVRHGEVARQLRRHGRGQRPPRRHAYRPLGLPETASSSTCAIRRSSPSSSCRGWSTSRWTSFAGGWTSSRATARSSSSAARASAPTTRRGSLCRTGSRPGRSPAVCCRTRSSRRSETKG